MSVRHPLSFKCSRQEELRIRALSFPNGSFATIVSIAIAIDQSTKSLGTACMLYATYAYASRRVYACTYIHAATTARAMHFDDLRCLVVLPFVAGQRMAISGNDSNCRSATAIQILALQLVVHVTEPCSLQLRAWSASISLDREAIPIGVMQNSTGPNLNPTATNGA